MSERFNVVVFGPTGTAGSATLRQCLEDERVAEVRAVTRRDLVITHEKLRALTIRDFTKFDDVGDAFDDVAACFFCLGISQSQAKDEAEYRRITLDFALAAAKALSARSPSLTFHFLSGQGADPTGKSWMMWARVKGETENELAGLGLHRLFVYRPAYIAPENPRSGVVGTLSRALYPVMNALGTGLAIRARDLAKGMLENELGDSAGGLFLNPDIRLLAQKYRPA